MDSNFLSEQAFRQLELRRFALSLNTAIPGKILAWDASRCLATVQPTIRMMVNTGEIVDGKLKTKAIDLPAIENVPACLPHSVAGGLYFTVPIRKGDPCLIIFSQRPIDQLVIQGGIQNPLVADECPQLAEVRHHDLTDAMFIPGLLLVPNKISNWATDAIEVRNRSGTVKLSVKADAVYVTGDLKVSGEVTAKLGGANIQLSTHVHGGVQGGSGDTGAPHA